MASDRAAVFGRDEQLARLDRVCGAGSLLVLRGRAGEGKSALLAAAEAGWRRRDARVLSVRAPDGVGAVDMTDRKSVV